MIFRSDKSPGSVTAGSFKRWIAARKTFIKLRSLISQQESYILIKEAKSDISSEVSKLTSDQVSLFNADITLQIVKLIYLVKLWLASSNELPSTYRELIMSVSWEVAKWSSLTKKQSAFLTCSFRAVEPADWERRSKKDRNDK